MLARAACASAEDTSEATLRTLASQRVDIHFVALNASTDKMYDALCAQYGGMRQNRMWKHDMRSKVSDFLPTVLQSLRQSLLAPQMQMID